MASRDQVDKRRQLGIPVEDSGATKEHNNEHRTDEARFCVHLAA